MSVIKSTNTQVNIIHSYTQCSCHSATFCVCAQNSNVFLFPCFDIGSTTKRQDWECNERETNSRIEKGTEKDIEHFACRQTGRHGRRRACTVRTFKCIHVFLYSKDRSHFAIIFDFLLPFDSKRYEKMARSNKAIVEQRYRRIVLCLLATYKWILIGITSWQIYSDRRS